MDKYNEAKAKLKLRPELTLWGDNGELSTSTWTQSNDPDLMKICFFFDSKNRTFDALVYYGTKCAGAPGAVHGGALATAMDDTLGLLTIACG